MREILTTSSAPIFNVPLSQGVKFGNRVFPSGMVGAKSETSEAVEGFEAQTRQVMENLMTVAKLGGMRPKDFVKCTAFLKDLNYFGIFNRVYGEYFGEDFPARSAFEIPWLAGPYELEVEGFGYSSDKWRTSERQVIYTENAPRFPVPLVQGIRVDNFIYPSGQVPALPKDSWPVEGFKEQTKQAIDNLIEIIKAAGGEKSNLVRCIVFIKEISRFALFKQVYEEYFKDVKEPPAFTCFGVTGLAGPYDMELEGIAYVGSELEVFNPLQRTALDITHSQCVRAGDLIFVSGQLGFDSETGEVPLTFEGQTRKVMENLMKIADSAGATEADILKTTCYISNIRNFEFFNRIYQEYFKSAFPARSAFAVAGLPGEFQIQVDAVIATK